VQNFQAICRWAVISNRNMELHVKSRLSKIYRFFIKRKNRKEKKTSAEVDTVDIFLVTILVNKSWTSPLARGCPCPLPHQKFSNPLKILRVLGNNSYKMALPVPESKEHILTLTALELWIHPWYFCIQELSSSVLAATLSSEADEAASSLGCSNTAYIWWRKTGMHINLLISSC